VPCDVPETAVEAACGQGERMGGGGKALAASARGKSVERRPKGSTIVFVELGANRWDKEGAAG